MKKIIIFLLVFVLAFSVAWLAAPAAALSMAETPALYSNVQTLPDPQKNPLPNPNKDLVMDNAELLSAGEVSSLTKMLSTLQKKYELDVLIVTNRGTGIAESDMEFADDYYDYNGFADDGLVLFINTDPNGWWISTAGLGIHYFTDYGIYQIGAQIRPDLSAGNWNLAFEKYIGLVDEFIEQAQKGAPFDVRNPYLTAQERAAKRNKVIVSILTLSLFLALLIVRILAYMMNTVRRQSSAKAYEKGFKLTWQTDILTHSNTTQQKIERSSSSGGGGGGSSTHSGSSGTTHGGCGGRF